MRLKEKLAKLKDLLRGYGSCLIAFSGGVDSTLLLKVASSVLPAQGILAVTAKSPTYPAQELAFAKRIAKELGVRHIIIKTNELKDKRFVSNPVNRCYFCKQKLFARLRKLASGNKLKYVCDASNISDKSDFRPGNLAKQRSGVRSPLFEAGLSKEDIRKLSRSFKLITWDKPSLACLASRIPYGVRITRVILSRIDKAESMLRSEGFKQCRLRHYNGLCRIEVQEEDLLRVLSRRNRVIDKLKKLGYNYVTLDLEGYRTGSMNPTLPKKLRDKLVGRAG